MLKLWRGKSKDFHQFEKEKLEEFLKYRMVKFTSWSKPTYYVIVDEDYNLVYRGYQISKFTDDEEGITILKENAWTYSKPFGGLNDVIGFVKMLMVLDGVMKPDTETLLQRKDR